ncbi:MAG: hypothetical protein J7L22_00190, partial [Candidatus Marinimicrobia bacterium]|nr:hypothetical protein [Candidatus Neomarinimicrobiota bacterium]
MSEKGDRQKVIQEILESSKISSQGELLSILESRGFATTQATLSRDLSALKIIKIPDDEKGYIYKIPREFQPSYNNL